MLRRRLLILAAALVAVVPTAAARAAVTTADLAPAASTDGRLAAYAGWVVWNERAADGLWRLVAWHGGVRQDLPQVAPGPRAFDLDVGPGPDGRPQATFSRCAHDDPAGHALSTGCHLRAVALPGGAEAELPVPARAGASDSVPSRWGSRIAFQRRAATTGSGQLLLYDTRTRKLTTLRHGYAPKGPAAVANALALDLGRSTLAFGWAYLPSDTGDGGATKEVRSERLGDRRQALAARGVTSGMCGADVPGSPNATTTGAVFLDRRIGCSQPDPEHPGAFTQPAGAYVGGVVTASGALTSSRDWIADAEALARDAATGTLYAVVAARLVRLSGLELTKTDKVANEPFDTGL